MQQQVVGSRLGLSVGIAQVEVFASAAARSAVLEAERVAQVAAGLPAEVRCRPTRLSELLVAADTDRAGVHAVLRDVADAQAQLHALQAAAVSRLAELQPAQEALPGARPDDPADPDRPDDWVADEVAVVLGIGVGSAASVVDKQRVLVEQLPQVWAALADGLIDVRRAQVLVDALAHRKRSAGGGLADDVVDEIARQGLRWIGEGIGPTPLADRIGGALIAADPAEADRRAQRRQRRQNVTTVGCGDGLAGLRADLLDAADAAAMQGVVDAMAATMRRGGDRRAIGVLRVEALTQLVTRPWETLPEDVLRARWQLRMRVDLADLDDLGPLVDPPAQPPAAEGDPTLGATATGGTHPNSGIPSQVTGSGVGGIGGLPVSPMAVAELLARYEALMATGPRGRIDGGEVWFEIIDATGRLRALTSPAEARAAVRRGTGLGPPPAIDGYVPSAAQIRFVKARDRHCRFPGCARPAEYADLDHVIPHDHDDHHDPAAGGPTCVTNLVCLCRRHHRLKTHAPGWTFAMDPDGTLHVTPPDGPTRTTRPACIAEVDMSTPTHHDTLTHPRTLTDLLGPTPKRFRTPTPEQRAARRAAAADRARLAAEIEAELDAASARQVGEADLGDHAAADAGDRAGESSSAASTDSGEEPPPF